MVQLSIFQSFYSFIQMGGGGGGGGGGEGGNLSSINHVHKQLCGCNTLSGNISPTPSWLAVMLIIKVWLFLDTVKVLCQTFLG